MWVGLQPDGVCADAMEGVGLKADPQEALPGARCATPGIAGATVL